MRKTITTLIDDIDGTNAAETVTFALDGKAYEIDLSEANATALRAAMGEWSAKARRSGARRLALTRNSLAPAGESRSALIRAWATQHGHPAPARGRIPAATVAAYDAAQ